MAESTSLVEIPFAGEVSGCAPLTWGQRAIWRDLRDVGDTLNIVRVVPLPAATTIEAFAQLPRLLLSHYPALRTRLRFGVDGEPIQVVSASGVFGLGVAEVDDDEDPAQTARQLAWRSLLTAFRYDTEWPLRVTVTRHRGVLTHAAWTFSHLSVGAGSVELMLAGLGLTQLAGEPAPTPVPARKPAAVAMNLLELAARERTTIGRRSSDHALRYWEKTLRASPPRRPRVDVPPGDFRGARRWHVRSHSPATYLGLMAVAERTRTDTARVLMALYSVALARITAVNPVVTRMVVDNRSRPGFAGIVGPLSQHGLFAIDVAGVSVDEAVARARTSALSAAKYAYYDPDDLDALLTRLGREQSPQGGKLRVGTVFNDRGRPARRLPDGSASGAAVTGVAVTAQRLAAAAAEFTVVWEAPLDRFADQLSVAVDNRPATIDLSVSVDTQYLPPDAVVALLREIQAVAVEAALDPATPTRVHRMGGNGHHTCSNGHRLVDGTVDENRADNEGVHP